MNIPADAVYAAAAEIERHMHGPIKLGELTRAALEAAAPHMLAEAWAAGATAAFDVSREGFNGEYAREYYADDGYPLTNPHSGQPWTIDNHD